MLWGPNMLTATQTITHEHPVSAVAGIQIDGHPYGVAADANGLMGTWSLENGSMRGSFGLAYSETHALACAEVGGRPHVVTGNDEGHVSLWDLTKPQNPRGRRCALSGYGRGFRAYSVCSVFGFGRRLNVCGWAASPDPAVAEAATGFSPGFPAA